MKHIRLTSEILKNDPKLKEMVFDFFNKRLFKDNIPRASVVSLDTPCFKWTGARDGSYGRLNLSLTERGVVYTRRAHIISYILHYGGPIGNNLVLHQCQEDLCVRPDHLKLGNASLNATHALQNRHNVNPLNKSWKLTTNEVKKIRYLYYQYNFKVKELQKMFDVTSTTISNIVNFKTWLID